MDSSPCQQPPPQVVAMAGALGAEVLRVGALVDEYMATCSPP